MLFLCLDHYNGIVTNGWGSLTLELELHAVVHLCCLWQFPWQFNPQYAWCNASSTCCGQCIWVPIRSAAQFIRSSLGLEMRTGHRQTLQVSRVLFLCEFSQTWKSPESHSGQNSPARYSQVRGVITAADNQKKKYCLCHPFARCCFDEVCPSRKKRMLDCCEWHL